MICTKVNELEEFMKTNLKPARYTHSLGVEKMARELAEIYGADSEKAAFAGRYHDIAKCFTPDVMNKYVRDFGLDEMYIDNNPLAHSKVAACILENEFGVKDEEVLDAVRSHTTGRGNMSLLEEIVYVSDAIEENRSYPELKALQERARTDIDGACLFIMDYTLDSLAKKGRVPDRDTVEARQYIIDKIRSKDGK
jgi:predicted HD superfamily hydrolase involved in NAD metabolism